MLIGICGAICAGKHSVQDYLIREHAFTPLVLAPPTTNNSAPSPTGYSAAPAPNNALAFATVADMVDYATANWQTNLVTTSIPDDATAETLCHRPFFLLVYIDAPLSTRYARHLARASTHPTPSPTPTNPTTLTAFLALNDINLYTPPTPLASLATRAHLNLLNTAPTLAALRTSLHTLNLPNPDRLRPTWTHYFMTLATLAARRSNCMRRQVGCVLTRANRVLSTGYNGTPRGVRNCNAGGCARCNHAPSALPIPINLPSTSTTPTPPTPTPTPPTHPSTTPLPPTTPGGHALTTCLCLHAEENALLEAGRARVGAHNDAVLYCNTCPCLTCSIKIVQVGIGEVVYNRSYYMDAEAGKIFREAGVRLTRYEMRGGGGGFGGGRGAVGLLGGGGGGGGRGCGWCGGEGE
ncbi:hypothetical protein LTR08_005738 [Meristemomyces frigidus]|nr:hypothetical protein LTR08_005738 [Meristemomyces frigidus]